MRDAESLARDGPGTHALGAAILACEVGTTALIWQMCSLMDRSTMEAWVAYLGRDRTNHSFRMFFALWTSEIAEKFFVYPDSQKLGSQILGSDIGSRTRALADLFQFLAPDVAALARLTRKLGEIRGGAFYVDWMDKEQRFRSPGDGDQEWLHTFLDAAQRLITAADRLHGLVGNLDYQGIQFLQQALSQVVIAMTSADEVLASALGDWFIPLSVEE